MAKKSQTNNLVTKADLKKLATKTELKKVGKTLRREILKVEERVENLEDGQKWIEIKLEKLETKADKLDERTIKMDKTLNYLRNTLDGFVSTVATLREENAAGIVQYRRHQAKLDNHEARLTTLESPTS